MSEHEPTTPFGKDPATIIRQEAPFNAGPPLPLLRARYLTPNERFFVRSHGDVPEVDPATYRLSVSGLVGRPLELGLDDLRRELPRHGLTATLQCAGNRRQDLIAVQPIPGELPWGAEAISNAAWGGYRLRDLLALAGVDEPRAGAPTAHVAFGGLDETERHGKRFCFGASIPLDKALHPDTLLADEMNGASLPAVHGAPLRVVVPGYIGARSVKWLQSICVQLEPSDNYFQAVAYRLFPAHVRQADVDWESGMMLGELSLNAVICTPEAGAALPAGTVRVAGYATAGGGRVVSRVDVSSDSGATWRSAAIEPADDAWAWRFWSTSIDLVPGRHELVVRAIDSAANTQPAEASQVWNFKGYMSNAWHRIAVEVAG